MPAQKMGFNDKKLPGAQHHPTSTPHQSDTPGSTPAANLSSTLRRTHADMASLKPHEVLDLQHTVGNHAVTRLLGKNSGVTSANPVQRHNDGTVHPHPHPPGGGGAQQGESPIQKGVSGLDLAGNLGAAVSTVSETVKPYAEGMGGFAGMASGLSDAFDPEKDKAERVLGGAGALTSAVQLGTQAAQFSAEYGPMVSGAANIAGNAVMPGIDIASGGYKAGKALWDASTVRAAQTKIKELGAAAATDRKPEIKAAADILDKIAGYKLRLNNWDTGTGSLTAAGGATALAGAGTLNPFVFGTGVAAGITGKVAGSDMLWKGLQWMSGSRVWSSERYNQEIKTLELQLIAKIDTLVDASNSKITQLGDLYQASKDIAPEFAEKLKTKALATRATTPTHRKYFD